MKNKETIGKKLELWLSALIMKNKYAAREVIKLHMRILTGAVINGVEYKPEDEIEDFTKIVAESNKKVFVMLCYYLCQFRNKKCIITDKFFQTWEKWIKIMKEYESITQLPVCIKPSEKLFKYYFGKIDNE